MPDAMEVSIVTKFCFHPCCHASTPPFMHGAACAHVLPPPHTTRTSRAHAPRMSRTARPRRQYKAMERATVPQSPACCRCSSGMRIHRAANGHERNRLPHSHAVVGCIGASLVRGPARLWLESGHASGHASGHMRPARRPARRRARRLVRRQAQGWGPPEAPHLDVHWRATNANRARDQRAPPSPHCARSAWR